MSLNDRIRKLCRICGDEGTIHIFGSMGQILDLSEKINTLLPIKITINDRFSLMTCDFCVNKIKTIGSIVETGVHTNELMIKLLNMNNSTFRERMLKLCRLCGNPGSLNIYNQFDTHLVNLADKINTFSALQVSPEDLLSLKICQGCVDKIEDVYPVFQFCRNTNKLMSMIVGNLNQDALKIESASLEEIKTLNEDIGFTLNEIAVENDFNKENTFEGFIDFNKTEQNVKNVLPLIRDTFEKGNQSQCLRCTKIFTNGLQLRRHILLTHNLKDLDCHHCFRRCSDVMEFENHIKLHYPEFYFPCDLCLYCFDSLPNLIRHIQTHNTPCTKEWAHAYNLPDNFVSFGCRYCNKTFILEASRQYHERIHFTSLICETCGKQLPNKSQLNVHQRQHTGERPYECKNCGSSFKCLSTLRQHEVVHLEKKYSCEVCMRKFSRPEKVRIHMRVHTGEKPYNCLMCSKKYQQKNDLNRHMKKKHGDMSYNLNNFR